MDSRRFRGGQLFLIAVTTAIAVILGGCSSSIDTEETASNAPLTVESPTRTLPTAATTTTAAACTATVLGRSGTITIVSGSVTCAQAQSILAERNGQIGYFDGPGIAWACGSQGTPPNAPYFCYPTDKSARFEWTPN